MKTTLMLLAATAMLSGCGLLQGPAPVDPRETLRRADLEAVDNPLLLAVLPEKGVFASLMPLVRKGDTLTWVTADGVTLAFENGVLIGSRGLGDDLMGGDANGTASAIAGGPTRYARRYGYLSGDNQWIALQFQCEVTARQDETIVIVEHRQATRRTEERCSGEDLIVKNSYWAGSDGLVWKSKQWVGPEVGYLETERLVR